MPRRHLLAILCDASVMLSAAFAAWPSITAVLMFAALAATIFAVVTPVRVDDIADHDAPTLRHQRPWRDA